MKYLFIISLLAALSCKKEAKNPYEGYGCVYGVKKATGMRELIRCSFHAVYLAGTNQAAADKVAEKYGVPKENVSNMTNYTNFEFIKTTDCNCR